MLTVPAFAASRARAPLERTTIERRDPQDHDVLIEIRYVGICHSDIHDARGEWGHAMFPMVPGHEITGIVTEVGTSVSKFQVDDRAGVGCFVDSCRKCQSCLDGEGQYCAEGCVPTYNGRQYDGSVTYGGYSTHIVVQEDYVLRIPDGLELDVAAPLLCGGTTMYSALLRWQVGPGTSVGLIGMGGLGHIGVKIASALGAEVTVISRGGRKREDALRFGARDYRDSCDPGTFAELSASLDLLVNTVSTGMDIDSFLGLLKHDGTMVLLGLPQAPSTFNAHALIWQRRSLAGSLIGGIGQTQEMLDFCAGQGIRAEIEVISASQLNEAFDRVVSGTARYRYVIDATTFAH
jgi:alcohol dehydrogenase (NADP+)